MMDLLGCPLYLIIINSSKYREVVSVNSQQFLTNRTVQPKLCPKTVDYNRRDSSDICGSVMEWEYPDTYGTITKTNSLIDVNRKQQTTKKGVHLLNIIALLKVKTPRTCYRFWDYLASYSKHICITNSIYCQKAQNNLAWPFKAPHLSAAHTVSTFLRFIFLQHSYTLQAVLNKVKFTNASSFLPTLRTDVWTWG